MDEVQRKVRRYRVYDQTHMADLIACLAANLEDAHRMAGVTDYTARECVELVAREVIRAYVTNSEMISNAEFYSDTTDWTDD